MAAVDLGKSPSDTKTESDSTKKVYYPTLFLQDVPELDDLPDGEFKMQVVGKVVSHTEKEDSDGNKTCSCEIEIHSIEPKELGKAAKSVDLGDSLDSALSDKEDASDEADPNDEEE